MRMSFICVGSVVAALVALSGCGESDEPGGAPQIAATTGIASDLATAVGGPDVEVTQVIPDGSSPHDFELSAKDRQVLEEADLVVAIGAALEVGVPLDDVDSPRWELVANVRELLPFEETGGSDPHVWMDPTRSAGALGSLADALSDADPAHATDYRDRAKAYATGLRRLDRELRSTLAVVPETDRELVTSHDSLGYLADRYGFEVVATAFPASGPEAEASAAQLREVADAIEEHAVPAVFAQQEDDPEALRLVADETGVTIEEGLIIESPASAGSYEEMLRLDAELIAQALGG